MNYSNIPKDLTDLCQWVNFDLIDGKKVPFTPGTDSMASSNRPRDWRSFRAACKDVEEGKRQHIGFCFSSTDPFVFVDLDDPDDPDQGKIFKRIDTYCQRSISGEGAHLICRGTFQGGGKHPAFPHAGLFKSERFCLMTADIIDGRDTIKDVPEGDLQAIHSWLGGGKETVQHDLVEYKPELPDMTVIEMGIDRFRKFDALCRGKWQQFDDEYHGDHSTADHAFLAMLCDLSESNEQVRWLFHESGMWTAERAEKKSGHGFVGYVDRTIRKIRMEQARMAARMSRVSLSFNEEPEPVAKAKPASKAGLIESLPDGLIKEMARYSYQTSYYPLEEASLVMALATMTVLSGRAYLTPSKQGLNMWLILVGGSSCGKDEFQDGISRLFNALHKRGIKSPLDLFGGELASGEAIEQIFSNRKRYLSFMTEFGKKFKQLASAHAPPHIENLQRALLNSYNSAGINGSLRTRERAQRADTDIKVIERPCLVLAGETTPEPLYGAMTQAEIDSGFLQRFTILNVGPESWSTDSNTNYGKLPPKSLLDKLEQLVLLADTYDVDNSVKRKVATVVEAEEKALQMIISFERNKRDKNRRGEGLLADRELGNRAAMKVWRLSTLLAVAEDIYAPLIKMEHVEWAIGFVTMCDTQLASKYSSGEVGTGQVKQESEVLKAAKVFVNMTTKERRKYGMSKKVAEEKMLLPLSVLKTAVVNSAAFSQDRNGSISAFEKSVEALVRMGAMTKVEKSYAEDNYDHHRGVLLCVY